MLARAKSWSTGLFRWLRQAQLLWLALVVALAAVLVALRPGANDLDVRISGLVLQLLGIGTVAHGIHKTRKFFGRPSILQILRQWLLGFPRWKQQVVVGTGTGSLGITGFRARATVWTPMDSSAPIEQQLKALRQNVDRLDERTNRLQDQLDIEFQKHSTALSEEQTARLKADEELQARLELAETGGLHITFVGVIWLFLGVILATLSPEIAAWRS